MRPVCLSCRIQMKVQKNGATAIEYFEPPGESVNFDKIYRLWLVDVYECRGCGHRAAFGFGQSPIYRQHQKDEIRKYLSDVGKGDPNAMVWFA